MNDSLSRKTKLCSLLLMETDMRLSQYLSVKHVAVKKLSQILWLSHKMVVMLDMSKCVGLLIREAAREILFWAYKCRTFLKFWYLGYIACAGHILWCRCTNLFSPVTHKPF